MKYNTGDNIYFKFNKEIYRARITEKLKDRYKVKIYKYALSSTVMDFEIIGKIKLPNYLK